jgi:Excreted virulence factor EspC, type VII ESX diderm
MTVNGLNVDPAKLREAATFYDRVADQCAAARAEHARTVAESESWGPLFAEARRAAVEAVNARESALLAEESKNRSMADQLRASATQFDAMDEQNAANLTISRE